MIQRSLLRLAPRRTALLGSVAPLHTTTWLPTKVVVNVPKMAESITEGTVVQIPKGVGSSVAVDEIVAVIETDKVAFEVRATEAGVITNVAVKSGENVTVGAPLLTVDTSASVSTAAATGSATPPSPAAPSHAPSGGAGVGAAATAPSAAATSSSTPEAHPHARVPSIRFRYGRREESPPLKAPTPGAPVATVAAWNTPAGASSEGYTALMTRLFPSKATRTFLDLPPAYGRPQISAKEAAAIESGGAY